MFYSMGVTLPHPHSSIDPVIKKDDMVSQVTKVMNCVLWKVKIKERKSSK
jgi:hypothetical protein